MIIVQSNQTVFDLATQIDGNLDNLVQNVMIKFGLTKIDDDITGKQLDAKFNINNETVKYFYLNKTNIETGDSQLFNHWTTHHGGFDNSFNSDYDN